jgi:hypothetical protein
MCGVIGRDALNSVPLLFLAPHERRIAELPQPAEEIRDVGDNVPPATLAGQ